MCSGSDADAVDVVVLVVVVVVAVVDVSCDEKLVTLPIENREC